jgi:hypothetical protein
MTLTEQRPHVSLAKAILLIVIVAITARSQKRESQPKDDYAAENSADDEGDPVGGCPFSDSLDVAFVESEFWFVVEGCGRRGGDRDEAEDGDLDVHVSTYESEQFDEVYE